MPLKSLSEIRGNTNTDLPSSSGGLVPLSVIRQNKNEQQSYMDDLPSQSTPSDINSYGGVGDNTYGPTAPEQSFADQVQQPNFLDKIFKDNPIARVLNYPFAKAAELSVPNAPLIGANGEIPGTNAREDYAQRNPVLSTGNETVDKVGDVLGGLGSFFTPIGGTGALNAINSPALQNIAERAGSSLSSGIENKFGQGFVNTLGQEAVRFAPQNVQYKAATENETSPLDVLKNAGEGALMGAAFGGAGSLIGSGLSKIADKYSGTALGDALGRFFERSPKIEEAPAQQPLALPSASEESMAAFNKRNGNVLPPNTEPIYGQGNIYKPEPLGLPESPQYNEIQRIKSQQTLGLPEAQPQTLADFNRRNGNVLPTNNEPIYGQGNVADPLGLPQGNYVRPTRLKVSSAQDSFASVMDKIVPQATERMTPPLENPNELAKWVQGHLNDAGHDVTLNEVRGLNYEDLRQVAEEMKSRFNPTDVVRQTAHDMGYGKIFDETAPSIQQRMAADAQSRAYGVPAQKVNIAKPQFNKEVTGQAAAPKQGLSFKREPKLSDARMNNETPQQIQQRYEIQTKEATDRQRISDLSKPLIGRSAMPETRIGRSKLSDMKVSKLSGSVNSPAKLSDLRAPMRSAQSAPAALRNAYTLDTKTVSNSLKSLSEIKGDSASKLKSMSQIREEALHADVRSTPREPGASSVPEGVQGFAGNTLPFRQGSLQSEQTINRNQVVNNIRKNLGAVIDSGRLSSGKGVRGEFKVKPGVIRTRMAEDLQVISHEVGHHLDKKFMLNDPQYLNELTNMANTANPGHLSKYGPAQHLGEGIAEYVRLRLTDPTEAKRLAPNFTRFFDGKIDKKAMQGIESSARDIDTWITQGDYNQAKGLIDFAGGTKKESFSKDKWYTSYVDDLNPLLLAEKALNGAVGVGRESVYKMARLSRGISQRAELAVTRGIYDDAGNKVGGGLREIVKPLEDMGIKEKDFATYLAVKHAQDLKALGKNVPFDDAQINAVMRKLDTPEVQAAQKKVIEYNDYLLDILVDAQILSKNAVSEMRRKYPNYVPFMRYFDDDVIAGFKNGGFGSAKGFANVTNPIKKMSEEGSTRTIINPIESMVKNTFLVMNAAAKNKVGLQLADLSKVNEAGVWVEHVGQGGASPHEHIISVFQNGERESYKVRNPELYNAMLSLDAESTNSLIKFLGGAASLLRAGATLTPDFMVRNAMRDILGNTVNSTKYGFNPLTIFSGLFHMVSPKLGGKSKVFDQFLSSGGAMSTLMSLDRDANREAMKAVFKITLKDKAMNVITDPKELAKMLTGITPVKATVGLLRKGSEISELSTRVGAFNKTLKKTGSLEEAAYTARDLMDFNRAGSSIRQANRAVAFMNANIQGTDRMVRAFKDNPASFMVRAFTTLVLPSIGLYYYNNNLPDDMKKQYENIPQWQKDSFFILGIPGVGFARIPKPFEAGMLFSTGTDRVMRYLKDHDPKAFKDYGKTLLATLTPPAMLTTLTPIMEAITNYSFFKGAPIVPQGEQRLEKKDQYGLYTSETSKKLGSLLSHTPLKDSNFASPRIIDNTIKGYAAGLGQYGVSGLDSAISLFGGKNKIPQPQKSITERAPLSSFMATTSGGGQIRQDFYDKWDEVSKAEASAKRNNEPYADPVYYRMKPGKAVIDQLLKLYKGIQADPKMTPASKRQQLDKLDSYMNDIARQSIGK